MDVAAGGTGSLLDDQLLGMRVTTGSDADEGDLLRRGPWTLEEDVLLVNYVAEHGEGRWNSLARSAGLKRTGKSCRLRWLNYLRPDVRRGNITPEEQLLILELHSRWGNRWSRIAQHLPGRTDNEVKNYWRTRVQKHAKQLRCDVNSKQFRDVVRYVWMPRLVERIRAAAAGESSSAAAEAFLPAGTGGDDDAAAVTTVSAPAACQTSAYSHHNNMDHYHCYNEPSQTAAAAATTVSAPAACQTSTYCSRHHHQHNTNMDYYYYYYNEPSQTAAAAAAALSPDDTSSAPRSSLTTEASPHAHHLASTTTSTTPTTNEGGGAAAQCGGATITTGPVDGDDDVVQEEDSGVFGGSWSELLLAATTGRDDDSAIGLPDFELGDFEDNLWSLEDLCLHQKCN